MNVKGIILLLVALSAFAQNTVIVVEGGATQTVLGYTGAALIYSCEAVSTVTSGQRAATRVAISAVSKAASAVVTSVAHGFALDSRPGVTISGATGTGWSAINGTFTATPTGVDTFTIPVNSAGFGTLAGTVVFTTTAPRLAEPEWAVRKLVYDGSNLIWNGWLNGTQAKVSKCSEATSTSVRQQ